MKGKKLAKAGLSPQYVIVAVVLVGRICYHSAGCGEELQYSIPRKCREENMYGGQSDNIPLKVNTAGVIPIIFSSS